MKKGQTKKTLTTIFVATMAAAFIFSSPMIAGENPSTEQSKGKALIMNLEYVPISEFSLINTEVSTPARAFSISSKQLTLSPASPQTINPVSPQNPKFSFEPKRQGQGGFIAAVACTVVLHAADYFTTRHALQYSRLQEGNPFMKKIVSSPPSLPELNLEWPDSKPFSLKASSRRTKPWPGLSVRP